MPLEAIGSDVGGTEASDGEGLRVGMRDLQGREERQGETREA